jgi:hypothetical protein
MSLSTIYVFCHTCTLFCFICPTLNCDLNHVVIAEAVLKFLHTQIYIFGATEGLKMNYMDKTFAIFNIIMQLVIF